MKSAHRRVRGRVQNRDLPIFETVIGVSLLHPCIFRLYTRPRSGH